jgi:hypothetical protein
VGREHYASERWIAFSIVQLIYYILIIHLVDNKAKPLGGQTRPNFTTFDVFAIIFWVVSELNEIMR